MNKVVRMALVLSLLTVISLPAFAVPCRICTSEGCEGAPEPTNTRCNFVLDPADCRQQSSPGCIGPLRAAMVSEYSVASIEITRPSERITIVSDYQATAELKPAADAPQQ
ncbi:MAG: hypothetical protein QOJ98_1317 [Acidobacteriota bacterium]|jgi:hypothetical protein|nr:hypothetical protein [Acidobacteriota bacterium]